MMSVYCLFMLNVGNGRVPTFSAHHSSESVDAFF